MPLQFDLAPQALWIWNAASLAIAALMGFAGGVWYARTSQETGRRGGASRSRLQRQQAERAEEKAARRLLQRRKNGSKVGGLLQVEVDRWRDLVQREETAAVGFADQVQAALKGVPPQPGVEERAVMSPQPGCFIGSFLASDAAAAIQQADALREAVRSGRFHHPRTGAETLVTASFGLAIAEEQSEPAELLAMARRALRSAGEHGRNQLMVAQGGRLVRQPVRTKLDPGTRNRDSKGCRG